MYRYTNYEVSEATKKVFRATAIERAYNNLMDAIEQFEMDVQYYEEQLKEKSENNPDFIRENDGYYKDIIIAKTQTDIYYTLAKDLLKL